MEKLANHTLVYDSDCPMCDLYTRGFIKAGMLDSNGRVEYGGARVPASFDNQRARNEIALVDYDNGIVTYGIDSLFKVIGHSFPVLKPVFRLGIVRYPLSILYKFISYNRKVIAPPRVFEKRGSCTPSYSIGYRVAYIVLAWLVTSLVITGYVPLLSPMIPKGGLGREFLICGGQIFFQMVFVRFMTKDKLLHYIGNMMTVSLIGALLLIPMLIWNRVFSPESWMCGTMASMWFALVVTFMLFFHWERVKKLGIPGAATATWVFYRVLLLWILIV